MQIGLIADPHANVYGTEGVLARLRDCGAVLCAGDLTGYFSHVNETVQLLRQNRVLCVRGNHDQYLFDLSSPANPVLAKSVAFTRDVINTRNLAFLSSLPNQLILQWDDLRILVCHGSPWDLLNGYVYPDRASFEDFLAVDADVIVLGHTHRPMLKRVRSKLIINPGSCGQPRNGTAAASCAILDTRTLEVKHLQVRLDMDAACTAAVKAGLSLPFRNRVPDATAGVQVS